MSELKEHFFCDIDEVFPRGYLGPLPSKEMRPYYLKSEADKVIAEIEENHKKEVDRLLMKIASLEKLVETADKLLKPKGSFTIEDIAFKGVKLEGFEKEAK